MNNIVVEKEAISFRQNNGMGANDPIRLKSLLTNLDVITVYKPLGGDFSGMALKVQNGNNTTRFMLINSNHSLGKQHFTISHELYHLFIQKEFNSMVCQTGRFDKKDKEEFNADYFAAVLLLPESGVKALIPDNELNRDKITLKTVLKIEHYYSCSRAALLYRLIELGIITKPFSESFRINIKYGALQHGYNTSLYSEGNKNLVLGNYGELAFELYENEKISESYYYTLLKDIGLTEQELQIIINGEEER
jgi:Zn-dependent peptidase ImmA (M78 family)